MKRIITVILLSAMLLTACGKEGKSVETAASETTAVTTSVEATTAKAAEEETQIDEEFIPKDEVGQKLIDEMLSEYVDDNVIPEVLTGERSEKLEEAVRNIRINNSRFALPLMIDALPEGFEVKYDKSSKTEYNDIGFNHYNGELFCEDELCATVSIICKDGADEKYGIIVGLIAMSNQCKWNFDGIEFSNDRDKITEKFGEPTFTTDIVGVYDTDNLIYISDTGTMVIFWEEINAVFCMNFNFDNVIENASLVEYVPYDDFDDMPEIPELSGEPRDIDWNMLFEDDCIVIGNDKYPVNAKISDFSEDITLFEYDMGKDFYSNKDYLRDTYLLMYKGREIAMVGATRTKDQAPEEAFMTSWMFTELDELPISGSVCGISFKQDFSNVPKIYIGAKGEAPSYIYSGIVEINGENYICSFTAYEKTILSANLLPRSVDPEAYDKSANSQ